ncbi:hypothetical protein GCM10010112_86550 [Actinoplanes lobatus]|uniref:PKD repeat protein n=1 Tax=Actinoplanes lobatus TaxID=113568 RepID=A0A7W7MIQ1_9ACTN|nr:PKD domain-containing protein [Actinoplanes lobatus]MBB4751215.1 PKD repeat protein [Actinoplanes lobatus]GGN95847.1 hypothetical protein GCM10010112_86550 [Actinoplanes lobatus]GIE44252.1 hypothetical protein Alo02nite_71500 [Actinoplanes lobatus]
MASVLSVLVLSFGFAGVAQAAPAEPAPAAGGQYRLTDLKSSQEAQTTRATMSATTVDPAETIHRGQYAKTGASLRAPSTTIEECAADEWADRSGGFVIDHFNWCHTVVYSTELEVCQIRIFVCVRSQEIGDISWRMTTKGEGWDATQPALDPRYSQISFTTRIHDIQTDNPMLDAMVLQLNLVCDGNGVPCLHQLGDDVEPRTIAEWKHNSDTVFRYQSDPGYGLGVDKVSFFDFHIKSTASYPAANTVADDTGDNGYRCDEATYLQGDRGCVFDRVSELFPMAMDEYQNYRKAALHIYDAMYQPQNTRPVLEGKKVAGDPFADQPRPLHRIYEPYDATIVRDNNNEAVRTCREWWGADYSQGGQFECDEYPFKSTYQGASQSNGHYSARVIDGSDNASGGAVLGGWYESQRILHNDPFYVLLGFTGTGGGGGGGGVIPDSAPTVNAGEDITTDEGAPGTLRGAVHDFEGAPSTRWTYRVTSGRDGMSCTLATPERPVTRITCNDEGTVEVTLTADDGLNTPVSDRATVTVRNAPPSVKINGPDPWQVFKAGAAVNLNAPFTDPGVLDTHTCSVRWDDGGGADTYPAESHTCDRRHTFAHAGMYTISVTVTDDGGASDTATTMIVVYDPEAGFVNADGAFTSAASAWAAKPTAGSMSFHLAGNYYHTDTVTGTAKAYLANTDLRLDAGNKGLEWLVVTPDGKVAARGKATVNGQSGYGFVYYGYDGCTTGRAGQCQAGDDRFRLVIWPLSSGAHPGNETWYDNRPEAGYDVDVTEPQNLTAGAVTIHPVTGP